LLCQHDLHNAEKHQPDLADMKAPNRWWGGVWQPAAIAHRSKPMLSAAGYASRVVGTGRMMSAKAVTLPKDYPDCRQMQQLCKFSKE
jgi:hypothetical protein